MGLCWPRHKTTAGDKSLIGWPKDSENILMLRKVFIGQKRKGREQPIRLSFGISEFVQNRIKAVLIRSNGFLWIPTFGHASWSNGAGGQKAH